MSTPAWVPDAEFDLDAHVREIMLPAPGSMRQLLDLAAQLYAEPLDRTRPLWRFVVIGGLEGGRAAIWTIIHHSVSDGIGQLRMAELYQQISRDEPPPADVDLDAVIAEAVAAGGAKEVGRRPRDQRVSSIRASASHLARRQFGIGRRMLGEVAMWPADPSRISDTVGTAVDTVRGAATQLRPSDEEASSGSPLWSGRSRHRHLEWVRLHVDDLKRIGRLGGGTVNDAFLAGLAEAGHRYHLERGIHLTTLNSSFVLSTRTDRKAGGNAFTPVPVKLPAGPMDTGRTGRRGRRRRRGRQGRRPNEPAAMTGLSGVANLLPDLGGDLDRTSRCESDRLRHLEPPRRTVPDLRVGIRGARNDSDGSGRRHRREHHRVVDERRIRHRHLRRSRLRSPIRSRSAATSKRRSPICSPPATDPPATSGSVRVRRHRPTGRNRHSAPGTTTGTFGTCDPRSDRL